MRMLGRIRATRLAAVIVTVSTASFAASIAGSSPVPRAGAAAWTPIISGDEAVINDALTARHGPPVNVEPPLAHDGDEASQHQADHGGLDNTSVVSLEATANPNAGLRTSAAAAVTGSPDIVGQWAPKTDTAVVPIFTTLLYNGKVLMWDSVGDNAAETYTDQSFTRAAVWDPATGTSVRVDLQGYNIFCAGFAHMPDGRIFVAGGNKNTNLDGILQTHIFDPATNTWTRGPDMAQQRWYPSVTELADGEHLVMGGGPDLHEVRQLDNTMRSLTTATLAVPREYPFIQTGLDGRVVYFGPDTTLRLLSPEGTGSWTTGGTRDSLYRSYGGYATFDIGKTIITGGGSSSPTATVVTQNGSTLTASATGNMHYGRRQHNTTVLADGTVLVTGGNTTGAALIDLNGGAYAAELWNPATGQWTELSSASMTRQYHSTALLLPDGRVMTGGGGICGTCQSVGYLEKNIEVFSPPYLFAKDGSGNPATRPTIAAAPSSVGYASPFSITTPDAARIAKVALVKLGAPTHSQDQDQRYVPLTYSAGNGVLTATSPANSNIAPPGDYMLFVVDTNGVPSIASIVRMTLPAAGTGTGLTGTYVNNTTLSGAPVLTRTEAVNFSWGSSSPGAGVNADNFSARWTGTVEAPTAGAYTFRTVSDDGVRLFVNGTLVIDNWTPHSPTTNDSAAITLTAGSKTSITMEYYEATGSATAQLLWKQPGTSTFSVVPANRLYTVPVAPPPPPLGTGLAAKYFNNTTLTGTAALSRTEAVNFDWGSGSPGTGVNANNFSARWTGTVEAPVSGTYTFRTVSDDGVRVWINGTRVINNWTAHSSTTNDSTAISLAAGTKATIVVEYYEATGSAVAKLQWRTPGTTTFVAVPANRLYL